MGVSSRPVQVREHTGHTGLEGGMREPPKPSKAKRKQRKVARTPAVCK